MAFKPASFTGFSKEALLEKLSTLNRVNAVLKKDGIGFNPVKSFIRSKNQEETGVKKPSLKQRKFKVLTPEQKRRALNAGNTRRIRA